MEARWGWSRGCMSGGCGFGLVAVGFWWWERGHVGVWVEVVGVSWPWFCVFG